MSTSIRLIFFYALALAFFNINANSCYDRIISFGDSIADTGNSYALGGKANRGIGKLPYGETYFHKPSGRFSDGRVIADFIAQALKLPLLPPYLDKQIKDFSKGVNFAVGGATALSDDFLKTKGIITVIPNASLESQLKWFKQLLPSLCQPSECEEYLGKSLILLGEIGGNDFNFGFFPHKPLQLMQSYVQDVINVIGAVAQELLNMGAQTLVVPGNFPIGCNSGYLTAYATSNTSQYDANTGCLNWLNNFVKDFNNLLQNELNRLRQQNPKANIIYADYYGAAMQLFVTPQKFGLMDKPLSACCGGGGKYNALGRVGCGDEGQVLCPNPWTHVFWDSFHMTEAAYGIIAQGLLNGPFASTPILKYCQEAKK